MNVITFFNPKGGTGKSTALIAVASGLLEMGERLAVLDVSRPADCHFRSPPALEPWYEAMTQFRTDEAWLQLREAQSEPAIDAYLGGFAQQGFNHVLIDTGTRVEDHTRSLLVHSDLIITPFCNALEAAWGSSWLEEHATNRVPVLGLATGIRDAAEERLACATFTAGPVFNQTLPKSCLIGKQFQDGRLFGSLKQAGFLPYDRAPRARMLRRKLHSDRTAVMTLCLELMGVLDTRPPQDYVVKLPLACGDAFAHIRRLIETEDEAAKG